MKKIIASSLKLIIFLSICVPLNIAFARATGTTFKLTVDGSPTSWPNSIPVKIYCDKGITGFQARKDLSATKYTYIAKNIPLCPGSGLMGNQRFMQLVKIERKGFAVISINDIKKKNMRRGKSVTCTLTMTGDTVSKSSCTGASDS